MAWLMPKTMCSPRYVRNRITANSPMSQWTQFLLYQGPDLGTLLPCPGILHRLRPRFIPHTCPSSKKGKKWTMGRFPALSSSGWWQLEKTGQNIHWGYRDQPRKAASQAMMSLWGSPSPAEGPSGRPRPWCMLPPRGLFWDASLPSGVWAMTSLPHLLTNRLPWVELCPPEKVYPSIAKIYQVYHRSQVYPLGPANVTSFGNRIFSDGIRLRILRWDHSGDLRHRHTEERGHVKMARDRSDAATGQECLGPSEAGRGGEGPSPRVFGGSTDLLSPWFWISSLRIWERMNFCCLKHPICGKLLRQP